MKKILFLILIIPTIIISQNKKQDLYIAYNKCSIHEIAKVGNDTIQMEFYQIRFGDKIKPEIEFKVTDSGFVEKHYSLSGKTYGHLKILYKNQNNKNQPIKVDASQMKNMIWAKNIIHAKNTDFSTFFKNFENIYIVDFNNEGDDIKIAKKVEIEFLPTL